MTASALLNVASLQLELEPSHREPVGERPSPEADVVSVLCGHSLTISRVNGGIEGDRLDNTISGRSICGNALHLGFKCAQIMDGLVALFVVGKHIMVSNAERPVIARSARRINHQQNHSCKRRRDNRPHGRNRNQVRYGSDRACSKKNLQPSQKAIEPSKRLLAHSMIGDLFSQSELKIVPFYFERFGGGGGGAKFVSLFRLPAPVSGRGGGGGGGFGVGGGVGFPPCDVRHVDGSIPIAPRCFSWSRGYADRHASHAPIRPSYLVNWFPQFCKPKLREAGSK